MTRPSIYTVSTTFEVYADIRGTDDHITFEVSAEYNVEQDDPAYDPGSGNSLTAQWCPSTSVDLDKVDVSWAEDTDDLHTILEKNNITQDFTLLFSYDADDMCQGTTDNRPSLLVSINCGIDILTSYSVDIDEICSNFASSIDVNTEEDDEY